MASDGRADYPTLGSVIDLANPLTSGLIGCWLFAEGAGTRISETTPMARPGLHSNTSWGNGPFGPAVLFNAASQSKIDLPIGSWVPPPLISVEVWCNTTTQANTARIFCHDDNVAFCGPIMMARNTSTSWRFYGGNGTIQAFAESTLGFNTNAWHHLVGTYDGATVRLYVDRVLGATTAAMTGPLVGASNTTPLRWGARGDSFAAGTAYTGKIALTRIWNRALKQDEVNSLYTDPYAMFEPLLVGRYYSLPSGLPDRRPFQILVAAGQPMPPALM